MSRPSDAGNRFDDDTAVANPRLGALEWLRWGWRQLTSMRTALLLLLALAIAAVPGSIIPQQSADPNGVAEWTRDNPAGAEIINALQGFDVYSSVWFSAIYLLLFLSLIGCVVPRVRHHLSAVRAAPPRTPSRLDRLPARAAAQAAGAVDRALDTAETMLKRRGYRTARYGDSVSAERGYLRETGNLLFHSALLGVLIAVFVGSGFTYTGQRVLVQGETFVNSESFYDTLDTGRFFTPSSLQGYSLRLDHLAVRYQANPTRPGFGQPLDYTATVTTTEGRGSPERHTIKVNSPLEIGGTSVYLLGNGYAPRVTVRNADGTIARQGAIPFRPVSPELDSLGVIKVRNTGSATKVGLQGFLYPWVESGKNGTKRSFYPDLIDPLVSLNVYKGTIGTDPENAYTLDTSPSKMTEVAGGRTAVAAVQLSPKHPTAQLPDGLGSITLDGIPRYAALDIHHDPSQGLVALFVGLAVLGLITSLLVPRRRMWVKVTDEGDGDLRVEYAGLARGDDPGLARAVADLQREHAGSLQPARDREPAGV